MKDILTFIREEEKKYKIMSTFSIYFVSLGNDLTGKKEEIKIKLESIKRTAEAIAQIILQQRNRVKQYQQISRNLAKQKEVLSSMIKQIEEVALNNYYESKEELRKIHAGIEAFDVLTKQAKTEAQLILVELPELERKAA